MFEFLRQLPKLPFVIIILIGVAGGIAQGEPWVSNRYAQNCAACHAPGRINKKPKDRRCTLTCQGCHVNPNGGGLRNRYGTWNHQRWLRSLRSSFLRDKGAPAPLQKQYYWSKAVHSYSAMAGKTIKRKKHLAASKRNNKGVKAKKTRVVAAKVKPDAITRTIKMVAPPDAFYDQYSNLDWISITAKNEAEFLSRIPKDDPYREERYLDLYAGGDIRYLYGVMDVEAVGSEPESKDLSFLMSVDLGARFRPIKYSQLSFVVESRFLNGPENSDIEDGFTSSSQVRSAYVLVDDLFWNTYFQAGLYRPMFGHFNPDHTSLAQQLSGLGNKSVYKAFGFGLAPNVPFIVVNMIEPMSQSSYSQDKGLVVSAGGRFVTMGASAKISYWSTENIENDSKRQMISGTLGGVFGRFILNAEFLRLERDAGDVDKGNVYTFETKYRVWRENYLALNYAISNVNRSLRPGSASEIMVGVKSFLVAGTELEAMYIIRENNTESTSTPDVKENLVQLQAHLFF